jgi:hypothetical protein
MRKEIDITGQKFCKLTAIRFSHKERKWNHLHHFWFFRCDCGKEKVMRKNSVKNGYTKSCGCGCGSTGKTHGLTGTRIFRIWMNINLRCKCKSTKQFKDYGGRGIKCLWKEFINFRDDA